MMLWAYFLILAVLSFFFIIVQKNIIVLNDILDVFETFSQRVGSRMIVISISISI